MAARARKSGFACRVRIVATSAQTLDGLQQYFTSAGVAAQSTRELTLLESDDMTAIVIFPDDFGEKSVTAYLREARAARRDLVLVAVTRQVTLFRSLAAHDGSSLDLVVLPRPSFGWTILDAIRSLQPN